MGNQTHLKNPSRTKHVSIFQEPPPLHRCPARAALCPSPPDSATTTLLPQALKLPRETHQTDMTSRSNDMLQNACHTTVRGNCFNARASTPPEDHALRIRACVALPGGRAPERHSPEYRTLYLKITCCVHYVFLLTITDNVHMQKSKPRIPMLRWPCP